MQIPSLPLDTSNRIKKGLSITLTILLIIFIIICLIPLLAFSPRDRSLLTQRYKDFKSDGVNRQYLIYAPAEVDKDTRIIVGIHGFGDSARKFAYYSGLQNIVSVKDIVIYPQAVKPLAGQRNGWNAEFCCGSGWKQGINDANFIMNLVNSVKKQYGIDGAKLYVTGFSNGGFMAQKLAVDYPQQVSAVAVMAGSIGTKSRKLTLTDPTPILLLHGRRDLTIPIAGGAKPNVPDFDWLPFDTTVKAWEKVNKNGTAVKTIIYEQDGHIWHDWRIFRFWHRQPESSQEIMKFFADNK